MPPWPKGTPVLVWWAGDIPSIHHVIALNAHTSSLRGPSGKIKGRLNAAVVAGAVVRRNRMRRLKG
jgi:hypothetical protein